MTENGIHDKCNNSGRDGTKARPIYSALESAPGIIHLISRFIQSHFSFLSTVYYICICKATMTNIRLTRNDVSDCGI